jgi:hypothetical protein
VRLPALAPATILPALLLLGTAARADESEMSTAIAEFDAAEKALTTTAPCDTMCKALQSMIRAADRICELARDGTATEQKRCTDARGKVAEATARVRTSCPNCEPSPPYAPSTGAMPKPGEDAGGVAGKPPAPAPAPSPETAPMREDAAVYSMAGIAGRATTTASFDVIPLFAPPWVVEPRIERAVSHRLSFAIHAAFGSLPKTGPEGSGRTSVFGVGGEARAYVFGSFDRFGVFFGADLMYRSARNVTIREHLEARAFPLGLTATALVGTKLVIGGGFTIEARLGPSFVIDDARTSGPRPRILPNGGVSLGWTF